MDFLKNILKQLDEKYLYRFNKRQKIYLAIFTIIVAILMWAFISAGVITHNFNRNILKGNTDRQNLEVKGLILTESKQGQKCWEIYGETGEYDSDNKLAKLNNMIGNFYKNNKVNVSFQSSRGTYDENTHIIDMYENTYVVLENEISVMADTAKYYTDDGIITAKGHVKINRKGTFVAIADEAIVKSDMTIFKIKGHTTTKIYESKNQKK